LETHAKRYTSQHGHPKRDVRPARPPQPEQADDKQRPADTSERDPPVLFLLCPRPPFPLRLLKKRVPPKEHRQRADGAGPDGQEAEPLDAGAQPVHLLKDDRVRLEGHVEDAVAQREVDARRRDDELEEEHADGAGEHAHSQLVQVRRLELVRRDHVGLWVLLADPAGPPDEEDRAVGLGEEDQRDHGQACVDEPDPKGPPPANSGGAEAGYDGGEERAEDCGLVAVVVVVSEGREGM
jgi:hypothetical protein